MEPLTRSFARVLGMPFLLALAYSVAPPALSAVLFSDDFNDNVVDTSKWVSIRPANRLAEEDGIMKLEQNATDAGPSLQTIPLTVSHVGLITIQRRVKVHYTNQYFFANINMFQAGTYWEDTSVFSVAYSSWVGRNAIIFGSAQPLMTGPVWDQWFDEKIEYDPQTGSFTYFVNGEMRGTINVGALPANVSQIAFHIHPYGWFTGHYQYFDDFRVTQSATAQDQIESLIAVTIGMNLQAGISNSIDSKLQNAIDALDRSEDGDRASASGMLYAFIQSVEAQRGKHLTTEQADQLVQAAQAIIDALLMP